MPRRLSVSNLYSQKFKFMPFTGEWKKILGNRERKGCWMIYGNAKNGKTSFALRLANYLSSIEKVLYIAAEEGYGYSYTWAVQKAGIREDNSAFHTLGYLPMEELRKELEENRKAEKIVFIDNLIAYKDELKGNAIVELLVNSLKRFLFFWIMKKRENRQHRPVSLPKNSLTCMCR